MTTANNIFSINLKGASLTDFKKLIKLFGEYGYQFASKTENIYERFEYVQKYAPRLIVGFNETTRLGAGAALSPGRNYLIWDSQAVYLNTTHLGDFDKMPSRILLDLENNLIHHGTSLPVVLNQIQKEIYGTLDGENE